MQLEVGYMLIWNHMEICRQTIRECLLEEWIEELHPLLNVYIGL